LSERQEDRKEGIKMIKCEVCKNTTKPKESTALIYTYRQDGQINSQKRVCRECYEKEPRDIAEKKE
jgi:hypothetical protein